MKRITFILYLTLTLLAVASCKNEDDVEEIFTGKTWYMNGLVINGITSSEETKKFYTEEGQGAYYITFASSTFNGKLSSGVTFSGTWEADGKHQTIALHLQQKASSSLVIDKQIYNILSNVTSYSSGASFLYLNDKNHNTLRLGDFR